MEHNVKIRTWHNGEYVWTCACGASSRTFKGRMTFKQKSTARLRGVEHLRRANNQKDSLRSGETVVMMDFTDEGTKMTTNTGRVIYKLDQFDQYAII